MLNFNTVTYILKYCKNTRHKTGLDIKYVYD